jgi:hypothetical protein
MRVVQPGHDLDFTKEPLRSDRAGERRVESLDGNFAAMSQVVRKENRAHPAATDLPIDRVTAS